MSTLIIEPITTTPLEQKFRLLSNISLAVLRVHLVKQHTPPGDLIVKILEGANLIKTITTPFATLNSEFTEDYGHGIFKFDINLPLKTTGSYIEYTLQVSASSYDPANYYSWAKDWEKNATNLYGEGSTSGTANQDTLKPYKFEIWEYK